jgi:hypothetical protein
LSLLFPEDDDASAAGVSVLPAAFPPAVTVVVTVAGAADAAAGSPLLDLPASALATFVASADIVWVTVCVTAATAAAPLLLASLPACRSQDLNLMMVP